MLNIRKHSQKADSAGMLLAGWLNGANYSEHDQSDSASRTKFLRLLKQLQDLDAEYASQKFKHRYLRETPNIAAHRTSINVILTEYPLTAYMDFSTGVGPRWLFSGSSTADLPKLFGLTTSVAIAVSLCDRRILWRLGKCAHCRRWFFSKRRDAKYCPEPTPCRVPAYRSRPENKLKHATQERERYGRVNSSR